MIITNSSVHVRRSMSTDRFNDRSRDNFSRRNDNSCNSSPSRSNRRRGGKSSKRPHPTPQPVTMAEQKRMISLTSRLLCQQTTPLGTLTPPLIRTIHETVFWHLHNKSYSGTLEADRLLRRLVRERVDGWNGAAKVATHAVEAVLDSWRILSSAGSGNTGDGEGPSAADRAESLLVFLRSSSGDDDATLSPSAKAYNMVIDAYARAVRPDDAKRIFDMHPNRDVVSYNSLLKAYSSATGSFANAADKAEQLLQKLERDYDEGQSGFGPNAVSYGTVIGAMSRKNSEDGARKAEEVLRRMARRYQTKNITAARPNIVTFAQVISAWAKSGSNQAGEKAEAALRWMEDNDAMAANTVCYNAAIDAWSRSPRNDAALRAESLLREMESKCKLRADVGGGECVCAPTNVTYTSVISAWSRSPLPNAAQKAEAILSDMLLAYERTGDSSLKPNKISYGAVLAAWARSDEDEAANRAEALVGEVINRYVTGEEESIRPNEVMFNSVIHALSKSKDGDTSSRARRAVAKMWQLYDDGRCPDVRPTTTTYNSLLNCCSDADEALDTLDQMQRAWTQGDTIIPHPDVVSFASVIDALASQKTANAADKAENLAAKLERMYHQTADEKLKPNITVYTCLVRALKYGGRDTTDLDAVVERVERLGLRPDDKFLHAVDNACQYLQARASPSEFSSLD